MSYSNVGKVWDPKGFGEYLSELPALGWAKAVCVHHTAFPNLAMRPKGWTIQHMRNLAHYYGREKGWSAGPHLFTDEEQIFGLSPLNAPGVHAQSFNRYAIGIEILGNYDRESPDVGRGAEVVRTTVQCVALLLGKLGLEANEQTILFHRDDPKTSKTCPGSRITKSEFVGACRNVIESRGEPEEVETPNMDRAEILKRVESVEWQLAKIREALG